MYIYYRRKWQKHINFLPSRRRTQRLQMITILRLALNNAKNHL